ncbi:MAG: hypothetical protein ACYSYV_11350 [Planctomycetota bacterium]
MRRLIAVLVPVLMVVGGVYAYSDAGVPPDSGANTKTGQSTQVSADPVKSGQSAKVKPGPVKGGNTPKVKPSPVRKRPVIDRDPGSSADSSASVNATVISDYETRTPPLSVFPPYLPYWNHGGWGTIKAYFPNGPNNDNQVYEQTFDPDNPGDMKQLRGVLESLSYDGPLETLGGILNGIGVIFCGPDNYHHGRGFEVASSLVRDRRPKGTPLLVFIDSNVDTNLLRKAGYAYVGKVSLEGNVNRNWDQVYDAAVAEALPWDVDILLVSGGMKGVTVGSNIAFPGAGGAYSQANYSVSLFGSVSSGITEGKGKAVVSAAGYRFWPEVVNRRSVPQSFYDRIQASVRPRPEATQEHVEVVQEVPCATSKENTCGVRVSPRLWKMAAFDEHQMVQYVIVE